MENLLPHLNEMRQEILSLMDGLDIPNKQSAIQELEAAAAAPDFWDDPQAAQAVMQRQAKLRAEVDPWQETLRRIDDAAELAALDDEELADDLKAEVAALDERVQEMAFRAMFSGPYDNEDAILAVHAGAGGVDAQDWAAMLLRMYLRWAELHGHKAEVVSEVGGDEAGIKSATLSISGAYAHGYLQSERGVHRLVRLSPFDANSRRHTSFALVEVWPDIHGEIAIEIDPKDLQVDTFRASGAGGQHVNKTESAVRITHLPTGIVVTCQNQRSQQQNKARALEVLKSRLLSLEQQKQEQQLASLKGDHISAEWGNQIRSYVLHPYQMVKDLRTDHETAQSQKVLDGELDPFMEAYLRYKVAQRTS
ncbi:MAG: peptide chain release factor 2 [Anaerolineae bacterium]|nr:peptide chain release factor 2 [Anaerolineae bacterium]